MALGRTQKKKDNDLKKITQLNYKQYEKFIFIGR